MEETQLQDAISYWIKFSSLLAAYTLLAWLGLNWAMVDGAGSPVWPASGLAVAALLVWGIRLWPAIAIGRLVAGLLAGSQQPLWAELILGLGNALATAAPALLINKLGGVEPRLQAFKHMIRFLLIGAGLGAMLLASIGAATLWVSSNLAPSVALKLWLSWSIGDFVGTTTVGPLVLSWSKGIRPWRPPALIGELILFILICATAYWVFVSPFMGLQTFHLMPLLALMALVFDARGASAALVAVSTVAIYSTTIGQGPFGPPMLEGVYIPQLQQFLAITAITTLLLSVTGSERRTKEALAERERQLKLAQDQAHAHAEELEVVLESVPAVVWVARDVACKEIVGNRFAREILRVPASTNLSKTSEDASGLGHFKVLDASGREVRPEELPVQRAARGEVITEYEETIVFDDGRACDLLGGATPLYDRLGNLRGAVAAFIDITERKKSERRERLLAHEVDHRAKNIMAVIQAVIQLTKAPDVESFRKACSGRIRSIARTHSLLAEGRWDGASLAKIIDEELACYLAEDEGNHPRVFAEGPDLGLQPAVAQSLGLVIHELATNSVKYGALSVPSGRLFLNWSVISQPNQSRLLLNWEEQDGPPTSRPDRQGFGLQMVRSTIKDQLKGELHCQWQPNGLQMAIDCPL
jgi:two-component sensor histidine kinase/integral membrane sensor domain MASE1